VIGGMMDHVQQYMPNLSAQRLARCCAVIPDVLQLGVRERGGIGAILGFLRRPLRPDSGGAGTGTVGRGVGGEGRSRRDT